MASKYGTSKCLVLFCWVPLIATQSGKICEGVDATRPAETLLQGKHLHIFEYVWPGFAAVDPTAPDGWAGYDIDLIREIAKRLGFTYNITELATIGDESWSDMLARSVEQSDLILSYWGATPERRSKWGMLSGHIDYSSVLVAKDGIDTSASFMDKVLQFARPFSWQCWLSLVVLIGLSGVVDYLLERKQGGSISASIYEYFAGTMWGGFEEPRSRLSAIYQVMLGFILMVVVAAYTANLAAFITVSALPAPGISSIEELIVAKEAACVRTGDPNQQLYESTLPTRLTYNKIPYDDLATSVIDGSCAAAITPRQNFDLMLTDGRHCDLTVVGASLLFSSAGWITNLNASRCVQRPIEMMLQTLTDEGFLKQLDFKWIQPAQCEVEEEQGRRLAQPSKADAWADGRDSAAPGPPRLRSRPALRQDRRQLSEGGHRRLKASNSQASTEDSSNAEGRLEFDDFAGILVLWVTATVLIALFRLAQNLYLWNEDRKKRALQHAKAEALTQEDKLNMVIKMQSHLRGHHVRVHKDEGLLVLEALYGKKLHDAPGFNSDGAAIRHMVKELHALKQQMTLESLRRLDQEHAKTHQLLTAKRDKVHKQGAPSVEDEEAGYKVMAIKSGTEVMTAKEGIGSASRLFSA